MRWDGVAGQFGADLLDKGLHLVILLEENLTGVTGHWSIDDPLEQDCFVVSKLA